MCEMARQPIKVKRKPVTVFTETGWNIGKWFAFPKPNEDPPSVGRKMKKGERKLWCPYCAEWTIYEKDSDRYVCQGVCGFANTNDFYVKTYNSLWFEDVPLNALKKMSIPAPSGRR